MGEISDERVEVGLGNIQSIIIPDMRGKIGVLLVRIVRRNPELFGVVEIR